MPSLAFYTCFIGSKNNKAYVIPKIPSENYDCYFYTNNKELISELNGTKWIPIYCNEEPSEEVYESNMMAKKYKVLPHKLKELSKYDYTCYFDTKIEKKMVWGKQFHLGSLNDEKIEKVIRDNMSDFDKCYMLLVHHNLGPNIYDEFSDSMEQERYRGQKDKIIKYIQSKLIYNTGILGHCLSTKESPHYCNGFILRNMNDPITKKIDETWYLNIQECGIQDQISFFFVKQFFATKIGLLHKKDIFSID